MNTKCRRRRLACLVVTAVAAHISLSLPAGAVGVTDPGVTACDRLASHPHDYKRVAPPIANVDDPAKAIEVCRAAVKKYPNHPRLQFLLGMLLDAEPRARWVRSPGLPYLKNAHDQGYLAATFFKGKALLKTWGRGRRREGRDLIFEAARKGHLQAQSELPRNHGLAGCGHPDYPI